MTRNKALATACLVLTGIIARQEIRKAGKADPDDWWLGHLDTIAEMLRPSPLYRFAVRRMDPKDKIAWFATDDYL